MVVPSILAPTESDIQLLLAAQTHLGTKNMDMQMKPYIWKRRNGKSNWIYFIII